MHFVESRSRCNGFPVNGVQQKDCWDHLFLSGFVYSQSRTQVSLIIINVSGLLAVATFDILLPVCPPGHCSFLLIVVRGLLLYWVIKLPRKDILLDLPVKMYACAASIKGILDTFLSSVCAKPELSVRVQEMVACANRKKIYKKKNLIW